MIAVVHYVGDDGADYFDRWLRRQSPDTRGRIQTRIDRVELGNLGDHKSVGKGVFELRQSRDVETAQSRWAAYQQETRNARKKP